MRIGDLCRESVIHVRGNEPVLEAARKMRRYHVGDLVILDPGQALRKPIGILTDRDIAVGLVAQALTDLGGLTVEDVMPEQELVTIGVDETLADAIQAMREYGVRRLPVVDERGVLVGIFTLDDALRILSGHLADLAEVARLQMEVEAELRP